MQTFAKKNANITLIFLVLFGFQRLWFILIPLFWFKVAKEKINYIGLGGSVLISLSLLAIKFEFLNACRYSPINKGFSFTNN